MVWKNLYLYLQKKETDINQSKKIASETLLEELAMLKKTDVEPAEKLRHLNQLTALSSVLFHSSTFSLEDLVPCKVFLKWYNAPKSFFKKNF